MHKSLPNKLVPIFSLLLVLSLFLGSCVSKTVEKEAIARVGDHYLYKSDVDKLITNKTTKADSILLVTNYINIWATQQLLVSKAKLNLSEEKLNEFNQLVANYKADLYANAYKNALVQKANDTTVSEEELKTFYEQEKENFKLKEKLLQLRYISLPKQFINKNEISKRLDAFDEKDRLYLDSLSVQFKKYNFNDAVWVEASKLIDEIPPLTYDNEAKYLKKSQFFELQDSLGVYLTKITAVLNVNDEAPLEYITPTIERVLLNRRRLNFLKNLEVDIIDEAIKNKEFEIYERP